mgnify:CR=1 FL=1
MAGLGSSPDDVAVNGTIDVYNQCFGPGDCTALVNFWRSVVQPDDQRRGQGRLPVRGVLGDLAGRADEASARERLHDAAWTTALPRPSPAAASSPTRGSPTPSSTARSSSTWSATAVVGTWSNGVWNQVFAGVQGAPAQAFPTPPYTTLDTNPASREKPFLYVDANGRYKVFVPDARFNTSGTTWANGQTPGHSIPIEDFFIAKPTDSVKSINNALARGENLLFTPGVYDVDRTIKVKRPDTIVLGLGMATLDGAGRRRPDDGART